MKKKLIFAGIGLVIIGLLSAGGYQQYKQKKSKTPNQTKVRIETIAKGAFTEIINAPGQIEPERQVDISAKVSARIMELPFDEGDRVIGEHPEANPPIAASVLIRLDSKDLESELRSAEANRDGQKVRIDVEKARIKGQKASLKATQAALEKLRLEFNRQRKLLASNDISQSTYEETEYSLKERQASYEAAVENLKADELNIQVMEYTLQASQARVDQAREALSYTTITSPIDGIVTQLNAEVGEVVMTGTMNNPGTVIMQIADLSKMLFVAQVDETNIGYLKIGQTAKIHIPAFWENEFEGIVQNIALIHQISNTGAKCYQTEIMLQGDVSKLYSGLTADADIEIKRYEDTVKVPSQAVLARRIDNLPLKITKDNPLVDTRKTEIPVVYRFLDGKAVATPVKIGPSDLTHTLITSGLNENDVVIVGPYKILERLRHNMTVKEETVDDAELSSPKLTEEPPTSRPRRRRR